MDPSTEAGGQGQEAAPAVPVQPTEQDQPQPDAGSPDPSQSSQGLIEPYLEGITDPSAREQASAALERFRADQDAKVTEKLEKEAQRRKAYEQYGDPDKVRISTQIVDSFLADPVETTKWLIEQGRSDLGVDIMSQLTSEAEQAREQATRDGVDPDQPLTASQLQKVLEEREKQQAAEQRRTQAQQQQAEQARQRALGWFEESVGRHELPVDDLPDGVKNSIFTRAQELRSTTGADGRDAIDMAVAEFAKVILRNGSQAPAGSQPEPTVAAGGTSPPPESIDVADAHQRRQAMLDNLLARTGQG